MSAKMNESNSNVTIKYTDVDPSLIHCEMVKMGKNQEAIPLGRYGSDNKSLCIQLPWIKLSQYGIPAGKELANGQPNKYYNEDGRYSIKVPLDTSKPEIKELVEKLEAIDDYLENKSDIKTVCGLGKKYKYNPIYREPENATNSKGNVNHPYIKLKFETDYNSDKAIKTEVYTVDSSKKNPQQVSVTTVEDMEKYLRYNSEIQPIIRLVKVWTQATGSYGVTFKLVKVRVQSTSTKSEQVKPDFLDDGVDNETLESKPTTTTTQKVATVESDDDDDSEDDEEVVAAKPVPTKSSGKKAVVESDDDDSDSEEEVVTKPAPTKGGKKVAVVESDDESEDEAPKQKSKTVTKAPVRGGKSKSANA